MKKIDKIFLNSEQVSEYLSIPLRTVQHLTKQGKIKAIRIGRKWRFKRIDIDQYFNVGIDFSKEPTRKPSDFTQYFQKGAGVTERRRYPRINTDFECRYSINLPHFKVINDKGIIKNLSGGGVFVIYKDDRIEVGDPINLEFTGIKVEGRVVRIDENGCGIKFRNIKEEDRYKIIEYVG